MARHPRFAPLLLPALLLAAGPAAALETADGALTVQTYGSVGYGRTSANTLGPGDKAGQYDNTSLALSVLGRPSDRLLVAGQLFFTGDAGVQVDWAFAEWKVNDAFRLRVGKAQQPFGLYGELQDVGTLRPFFDLPIVIYGPAHIVAEGYTGAGITGFHRLSEGWGLAYDLYGGELDAEAYEPYEQLVDPTVTPGELENTQTREVVGGRLDLETPVEGLSFLVSAYTGTEKDVATDEVRRHVVAGAGVEYLTETISARAEYALLDETSEADTQAAYLELAYKFPVGLQLAGRVEGSWVTMHDGFTLAPGTSPLLRHQEAAAGVNYWFSRDLVVKASYHFVDGNRFAYGTQPIADRAPNQTTHLFVVGAQFSF